MSFLDFITFPFFLFVHYFGSIPSLSGSLSQKTGIAPNHNMGRADAAIVFAFVGESWTMPSFGWDCTNLPMFTGDRVTAGKAVQNVYNKAIELGVGKIVITECCHAFRSLQFEVPYMAGYADGKPPVEIIHMVRVIY